MPPLCDDVVSHHWLCLQYRQAATASLAVAAFSEQRSRRLGGPPMHALHSGQPRALGGRGHHHRLPFCPNFKRAAFAQRRAVLSAIERAAVEQRTAAAAATAHPRRSNHVRHTMLVLLSVSVDKIEGNHSKQLEGAVGPHLQAR